ncbi:MetQ/NlpA family ABC transporter substrate-binding protein [Paenibacillus mendelii]|uniref:Lipoprotein n=1 Tax=Paenibacillus mendelii TaxID=206163 RepID=A0ABV6J503_9BACL|nr:MetQ/NlpA family ABC transporter substrate-binding protein [Paenibacillus mendelii]MCQ6561831.1 MetQ/NlpA family ABC transporter substrate-binding protein [Paenibacillus mendelii]
MKKSYASIILGLVLVLLIAGCGSNAGGETNGNANKPAEGQKEKLKVGISSGPESEDVWKIVKENAAKDGVDIELVIFNDYVQPNQTLEEGQLDANAFQHLPYLEEFNASHNTHIVRLADTINYPVGIYSDKIKDLSELKEGDELGLPNDPSNGARALILFEKAGLIKLKEGVGAKATIRDIVENPKKLKFKELDAAFLPKALGDLTAAMINTNFAVENGLDLKEAIYTESKDSPWVNIIAVREADKDKPIFQKLISYYHSDEVKKFVEEKYGEFQVPAW